MMQQNIFEGTGKNASIGLIITIQQKKILSKQQQAFNKFIMRIEKLRLDVVRIKKIIDDKLDFYVREIHPVEQQLNELNKEAVKLLFPYFKSSKILHKTQRHNLGNVIASLLDDVFNFESGEPDEEFKSIFKAVQGISYEKSIEVDFDSLKDTMEAMFDLFGFEMDLKDLHTTMTPEEIIQKTLQMQEAVKQKGGSEAQKKATGKKSKKELEREEKASKIAEAREKNISSIYKQLAKILHPDLEQNETLKLQKEELMKQLTIAYENNDLHTLLNLELKWIQNEENNTVNLTDDKLSIYNEVLKEQLRELEQELNDLYIHPRYQSLHLYVSFPEEIKTINLKAQKHYAEVNNRMMLLTIKKLKGTEKQAVSMVKEMISDFMAEQTFADDLPF